MLSQGAELTAWAEHHLDEEAANHDDIKLDAEGFRSFWTAARPTTAEGAGTHGGTAIMCNKHLQVGNLLAKAGQRCGTNPAGSAWDWTAATWQLGGLSITVVALYMEAAEGASPANYSKFTQVAAYLRAMRSPIHHPGRLEHGAKGAG